MYFLYAHLGHTLSILYAKQQQKEPFLGMNINHHNNLTSFYNKVMITLSIVNLTDYEILRYNLHP